MSAMTVTCNAGGMPLGVVRMQDAVAALAQRFIDGSTDTYALISDETRLFRSVGGIAIPAPLVIVTGYTGYADVSRENRRPTKHVLFARDGYTCQYCGFVADPRNAHKLLTVDHVQPIDMFGSKRAATTWDNIVACCRSCNARKGGKLPRDVRGKDDRPMLPKTDPRRPEFVQVRFAGRLNAAQRDYVNQFLSHRNDRGDRL